MVAHDASQPHSPLSASSAADPDRVLAAAPALAVEPPVERLDIEPLLVEYGPPLRNRKPRERHLRLRRRPAQAQDQGPRPLVPVGALPNTRLALDPATV